MFRHLLEEEEDAMATEQAALALIAIERLDQGKGRLYDMSEIAVYEGADDLKEGDPENSQMFPWILAAVGVLAAGTTGAVMIKRRKKVCTK